jgi:uncharacterized protein
MALEAQLKDAVKTAMKQGQPARLEILRFLLAQLQAKSIEKRGTGQAEILNEEDVLQVLQKEAKKRKEAAELYVKGGRPDLAEKEEAELVIIYEFIPQPMDRAAVAAVVDELGEVVREKLQ